MRNYKMLKRLGYCFLLGSLLYSYNIFAAVCSVSATSLAFGNYDVFSLVNNDSAATITVTCDVSTAFTLTMSAGNNAGASVSNRLLAFNAHTLNFNIYSDPSRVTIWGDGVTGNTVSGTGTSTGTNLTAYGRIPATQNVPAGQYSENITLTLNY